MFPNNSDATGINNDIPAMQFMGGPLNGMRGLGDDPQNPLNPGVLTGALTAIDSQVLFFTNMQRAAQGLPLLAASGVGPNVNVGVQLDQNTMLMIGAAALGLFMLLKKRG